MPKKRAVRAGTVPDRVVADANGAPDAHSLGRDTIQAAVRAQHTVQSGQPGICSHAETIRRLNGIAVPALAFRYLLYQDALPLGRTLTLSGLFRSNKTALAFELARWMLLNQGLAWYDDVEKKDSPDMRQAIMNHDPNLLNYLDIVPCDTQEQWQGAVTKQFDNILDLSEKHGYRYPGISIVDSVAAAKPKSETEKFAKEYGGAGKRAHPVVALINSDWLTSIVHYVNAGPFILLLIQHSSEVAVDGMPGVMVRKQKGGGEIGFAKTTALEMTRIKDLKETDSGGGCTIKIACTKNSLGPANRTITVPVKWWWEPTQDGGRLQRYVWDWHTATLDLLFSFETTDGRKGTWKSIREVCDLRRATQRRVWSRTLGIPESSPVKYHEAGQILEFEHPELLPPLYSLLGITRRQIYQPGADIKALWQMDPPAANSVPLPTPYPRMPSREGVADDDE